MINIKVNILISSGSGSKYLEYDIKDVESYYTSESGYYYVRRKDGSEYYFPINKTILEISKIY